MAVRSPLVLSLGDPCGIGPEIVALAWHALKNEADHAFCVVGDAATLAKLAVPVCVLHNIADTCGTFAKALPVLNHPLEAPAEAGKPDVRHAPYIIEWIAHGVRLCREGTARALVTAPIAKSVLYEAGFAFPGHTEFLADLCRGEGSGPTPVMMLTARDLRVVLATIHIPLHVVSGTLSVEGLQTVARITAEALKRDFAISKPRIAVAGLNPHAGENGTIGREELDILVPAIAALRAQAMDVSGPYPADSLFHDEARSRFDAVLCMYHDQGLIPLKTLDFWGGVNVTLGLPIVRTSPDHGTGFDIAGRGIARADSLINAIRLASYISENRLAQ